LSDNYALVSDSSRRNHGFAENFGARSSRNRAGIKERSRATGLRESDVVRKALEKHLSNNDEPIAFDRASEAGLIGCVRSGRKDLSTNKKYFKGFGRDE